MRGCCCCCCCCCFAGKSEEKRDGELPRALGVRASLACVAFVVDVVIVGVPTAGVLSDPGKKPPQEPAPAGELATREREAALRFFFFEEEEVEFEVSGVEEKKMISFDVSSSSSIISETVMHHRRFLLQPVQF